MPWKSHAHIRLKLHSLSIPCEIILSIAHAIIPKSHSNPCDYLYLLDIQISILQKGTKSTLTVLHITVVITAVQVFTVTWHIIYTQLCITAVLSMALYCSVNTIMERELFSLVDSSERENITVDRWLNACLLYAHNYTRWDICLCCMWATSERTMKLEVMW